MKKDKYPSFDEWCQQQGIKDPDEHDVYMWTYGSKIFYQNKE